ncbi:L,D-transpeptidase family protein [Methyloceanibacter methanicus]|uniref:L,D-transpeptidase family protein n=1 Tax=Methyloceanibacter methanicus TaxID=1774968 RepID=UPI003CC7AA2B
MPDPDGRLRYFAEEAGTLLQPVHAAPMPWMQRLTRSGTALHAGAVPNRPASHGCVRMPYSFAPKLFRMTEVGGKVAMMTGPMVKPQRIKSPTLVLPASPDESDDVAAEDSVDAGLRAGVLAAVLAPGAKLADTEDAANENDRPWHILVTRREERDIAIGSQQALAALGYLDPQDNFVGYLGDGTKRAIRASRKITACGRAGSSPRRSPRRSTKPQARGRCRTLISSYGRVSAGWRTLRCNSAIPASRLERICSPMCGRATAARPAGLASASRARTPRACSTGSPSLTTCRTGSPRA